MFNYFSALGDPTRGHLGVSHNQWRRFCKASRILSVLGTATVDLFQLSKSQKIIICALTRRDGCWRNPRASSVSTDPEIDQATNAAADADFLSPPDMNSAQLLQLRFCAVFRRFAFLRPQADGRDSLLQISIHEEDGAVSKFLENYMYPLAAHLMESLVSTPIARRKSIRRMLVPHSEAGGKSSRTLRILRRNRKLFRVYEFYKVDPDKN